MIEVRPRPKALPSQTVKEKTGCGSIYIRVSFLEGEVFEVFAQMGKAGGCCNAHLEALSKSISLGLRARIPLSKYLKYLSGIHCPTPTLSGGVQIWSCADAIAKALEIYLPEEK